MIAILLILAALTRPGVPQTVEVDRVEIAEVTDGDRVVFRQIVLWRWAYMPNGHRFIVADWAMLKAEPLIVNELGKKVVVYRGEDGPIRVRTSSLHYTRGSDSELANRDIVPPPDRDSYFPAITPNRDMSD